MSLLARVQKVDAPPPASDHMIVVQRNALLDFALSDSLADARRKSTLKILLTSDIESDKILLYTQDPDATVEEWAQRVADAMYPAATPIFPRSRWLNSSKAMSETLLLSIHNTVSRSAGVAAPLEGGAGPRPRHDRGQGPMVGC